jgi:hypothetical protein
MACGCSQKPPRDQRSTRSAGAVVAAATSLYEVLNSRGTPTGQRYTSLVSATSHARRIGGSTRPVTGG